MKRLILLLLLLPSLVFAASNATLTGTVLTVDGDPCDECQVKVTSPTTQSVDGVVITKGLQFTFKTTAAGQVPTGITLIQNSVIQLDVQGDLKAQVKVPAQVSVDMSELIANVYTQSGVSFVDCEGSGKCLQFDNLSNTFICMDSCGGGGGGNFSTIHPSSGTDAVADSMSDTLNLAAGPAMTVTGNGTTDTVTFGVAPGGVTGTEIANATIGVGKLSASGSPSSTTYLRGDNTWANVISGASASFTTMQTDSGSNPVATGGTDTLRITTSDSASLTTVGDSATDKVTINLVSPTGTGVLVRQNDPDINTPAIDGGTIHNALIGASSIIDSTASIEGTPLYAARVMGGTDPAGFDTSEGALSWETDQNLLHIGNGSGGLTVIPKGNAVGAALVAMAFDHDPTACPGGQYVNDIANDGTLTCGTPAGGGGGAPTTSGYILKTPDATLTSSFALSTLGSGILLNTTGTGVPTIYGGATCSAGYSTAVGTSGALTCSTNAVLQTTDTVSGTTLLARSWVNTAGTPVRIEVWPETTIKTDEGAAATAGTIAWAEAQLSGGGEIFLHTGTYNVGTTIRMDVAGTVLRCASQSAVLQAKTNLNSTILQVGFAGAQRQGMGVYGCAFNGNPANQSTSGTLIALRDLADVRIENNYFRYWKTKGMTIGCSIGTVTAPLCNEHMISRNLFYASGGAVGGGGSAIEIVGGATNPITDSHIMYNDIGGANNDGDNASAWIKVGNGTATGHNGWSFQGNHVYGTDRGACLEIADPIANTIDIQGNTLESCTGGIKWTGDATGSAGWSLIQGNKMYGYSRQCTTVTGNYKGKRCTVDAGCGTPGTCNPVGPIIFDFNRLLRTTIADNEMRSQQGGVTSFISLADGASAGGSNHNQIANNMIDFNVAGEKGIVFANSSSNNMVLGNKCRGIGGGGGGTCIDGGTISNNSFFSNVCNNVCTALEVNMPTFANQIHDLNTNVGDVGDFTCLTGANPCTIDAGVVTPSKLASMTSAQLAGLVTDEQGTAGFVVFSVGPTLTGTTTIAGDQGKLTFDPDATASQNFVTYTDGTETISGIWQLETLPNGTYTVNNNAAGLSAFVANSGAILDYTAATNPVFSSIANFFNASYEIRDSNGRTGTWTQPYTAGETFNANNVTMTLSNAADFTSTPIFKVTGGSGAFGGASGRMGFYSGPTVNSGTLPAFTGLYIGGKAGAGTLTTQVGVDIGILGGATNNIGFRNASTTYFSAVTQTLATAAAVINCSASFIQFDLTPSGTTTLTANPMIGNPTPATAGAFCIIQNNDATATDCAVFTDNQGVALVANRTLCKGDTLAVIFNGAVWTELFFADN